MAITGAVRAAVKAFQRANPDAAGKAKLTSGNRTIDEQIAIVLDPKRARNYRTIKKRFIAKFKAKALPAYEDLQPEETAWWQKEVKKQAGKPNGFAHVGGNAQDVSIKKLPVEQREALKKALEDAGFGVLMELVTKTDSQYDNISIDAATVFHVHKR